MKKHIHLIPVIFLTTAPSVIYWLAGYNFDTRGTAAASLFVFTVVGFVVSMPIALRMLDTQGDVKKLEQIIFDTEGESK